MTCMKCPTQAGKPADGAVGKNTNRESDAPADNASITEFAPPAAADGPFLEVAYCYDGTLEGLLSAIFAAYERHEDPTDVTPRDRLQPRLGQRVADIPTNMDHALRVRRGLCHTCGAAAFEAVRNASLSDDPDAGTAAYRFVRYALPPRGRRASGTGGRHAAGDNGKRHGDSTCEAGAKRATACTQARHPTRGGVARATCNPLSDLTHPAVEPLVRISRAVANERHRMMQFLRFEHLEGGAWFARCRPNANVIPLLMGWFSARFNTQPFIIYDEAHHVAGVYEGLHDTANTQIEASVMVGKRQETVKRRIKADRMAAENVDSTCKEFNRRHTRANQAKANSTDTLCEGTNWYLIKTDRLNLPDQAADEKSMQQAWKRFYRSVSVESRYHPELRRQFMPKRLWENITEMQEDLPGKAAG